MTGRLVHLERPFPSCNLTLVRGDAADLLVDSGAASDIDETVRLLGEVGVDRRRVRIFNTHWHSDHVGGNAHLRHEFGAPVLTHRREGARVQAGDPEASGSDYLDQPVPPYVVDELLEDGDVLDLGGIRLEVVPTTGHSLGHASLYDRESRTLVAGDALLARDVAWINPFLDGADALDRAAETMARIRRLGAARALSGHGPEIDDVEAAVARSLQRLERWRLDPEAMAWHGCRRVFAYALMIHDGIAEAELWPYLRRCRWVHDFAPLTGLDADAFARRLVAEMDGHGAEWRGGRLYSTAPHRVPASPLAI